MAQKKLNAILDHMDMVRQARELDSRMLRQNKGMRHDWSLYLEDNLENLYN